MWERCERPNTLDHKKIVLAIRATVSVGIYHGEKYIGYVRGCDAVVVAFDSFKNKDEKISYANRPLMPKGSCSSSSSSSESEDDGGQLTAEDVIAQYVEFAKSNMSVSKFLETLQQQLPQAKSKPSTVTWEKAKTLLLAEGWNGGAIEWWKSKTVEVRLPRLYHRTKFLVQKEESGAIALEKAGIIQLRNPKKPASWLEQPATVRRFWRAILGFLAEFSTKLEFPEEELCSLFDYANYYLPAFWRFKSRKLAYVRDLSYKVPLADRNYFIRIFDFAVVVRRMGIGAVWAYEACALPAKAVMENLRNFFYVRYPWVEVPSPDQLVMDMYLDQACEFLWNNESLFESSSTEFSFNVVNLERVVHDCIDVCPRSKQMERFNTSGQSKTPIVAQFSQVSLDNGKIWTKLKQSTCHLPGAVTFSGPRNVNLQYPMDYDTKLIPLHCVPQFMQVASANAILKRNLFDLNYTIAPANLKRFLGYLPKWLFELSITTPKLPVYFESMTDTKRQLVFSVLAQDEELWLSQRKWSQKQPLYRILNDELYINTGYAVFSRELLKRKISFLLSKFSGL
jgi:hypothetical protein